MPRENRCQERIDAKRFILRGRHSILVKLECDFSWQAQDFVTFWEIAGARNVVFFHTKCVSKIGRVRSPKRRVRDDDFIFGSCSDHARIMLESSLYWRKQFRDFPLTS